MRIGQLLWKVKVKVTQVVYFAFRLCYSIHVIQFNMFFFHLPIEFKGFFSSINLSIIQFSIFHSIHNSSHCWYFSQVRISVAIKCQRPCQFQRHNANDWQFFFHKKFIFFAIGKLLNPFVISVQQSYLPIICWHY